MTYYIYAKREEDEYSYKSIHIYFYFKTFYKSHITLYSYNYTYTNHHQITSLLANVCQFYTLIATIYSPKHDTLTVSVFLFNLCTVYKLYI